MAVPEMNMSVVVIMTSMDIKAFLPVVLNVSVASCEELNSLVVLTSPLSHNSSNSNSESISSLVRKDKVSS
jgi:hypothetical protein